MKDVFKTIFVIIGTMIGAGFASGKEINLFFNNYGTMGIMGIIISCILTGFIIYKVFKITNNHQIHTYSEFLQILSCNKKVNGIIKIMVQGFLLVSFFIMIAGFSAYFNQEFGAPIYIMAIAIVVVCYITFLKNTKGIVSINTILIPLLCLFIFYLGTKNINFTVQYFENNINIKYYWGWLFSSILYASYNSIILVPILIELSNFINTKEKIKKVSLISSITLATLALILFFILLRGDSYIQNLELPMIQITKEFGNGYSTIYGVTILIAIFTTAIASGYSFLKSISGDKRMYKKTMLGICMLAVAIAPLGFSNLVNLLYPIFGVIGLIQIFNILKVKYL